MDTVSAGECTRLRCSPPNVTGVVATAKWLTSLLGTSQYENFIVEQAIDGECMQILARNLEDLQRYGMLRCHAVKIFEYFHPVVVASSNYVQSSVGTFCRNDAPGPDPALVHRTSMIAQASNEKVSESLDAWPSYDSIFKHRRSGKLYLRQHHPEVLRQLLEGHSIIRSWFRNHDYDQVQSRILFADFRAYPEIRTELDGFIRERMNELSPLRFKHGDDEASSYLMSWKHETVYKHVIGYRQHKRYQRFQRRFPLFFSTSGAPREYTAREMKAEPFENVAQQPDATQVSYKREDPSEKAAHPLASDQTSPLRASVRSTPKERSDSDMQEPSQKGARPLDSEHTSPLRTPVWSTLKQKSDNDTQKGGLLSYEEFIELSAAPKHGACSDSLNRKRTYGAKDLELVPVTVNGRPTLILSKIPLCRDII